MIALTWKYDRALDKPRCVRCACAADADNSKRLDYPLCQLCEHMLDWVCQACMKTYPYCECEDEC